MAFKVLLQDNQELQVKYEELRETVAAERLRSERSFKRSRREKLVCANNEIIDMKKHSMAEKGG